MRRILSVILLSGIVFACSLLEDDEITKLESAEFYETGDSNFPVIAIDETETIFGFSANLSKLFAQLPDGDQWLIKMGTNGYPESMYVQKDDLDLLLLFSEFNDDIGNVALINQNTNTTDYFYDIEFFNISQTSSMYALMQDDLKSAGEIDNEIMSWWDTYGEAVKKMAGPVIGGIGCGMSSIAAVGSGGMATPIAVLSCGSWASSITGDIVGEESTAGGALFKGGSMVGKYGEMVLKCGTQNWGSCALAVGGEIGAIANLLKYGAQRSNATEAKNQLQAYVKTGGLAGTWQSEEIQVAGGSYSGEYYFGLNAGRYTQYASQTDAASNTSITTTTKLTFSYSTSGNTLTTTMTRVEIEASGTQGGQSYSQSFGPYTWEEFTNTVQYQNGGYTDKTSTMDFEIEDNGQKLVLANGQEFSRVN